MWMQQALMAFIGLSAGIAAAGGLFAFIVELGVVADFADRTHTGDRILLYEDCVALGGILGNLFFVFRPTIMPALTSAFQTVSGSGTDGGDAVFSALRILPAVLLAVFGLFSGIFVGCWAMALAEILNVFPVFMRRARIVRYTAAFVISTAVGKGLGSWFFFYKGW